MKQTVENHHSSKRRGDLVRLACISLFLVLLGACSSANRVSVKHAELDSSQVLSDAEPVDPAEQRPAVSPPMRPSARGAATWQAHGPAPTQDAQVAVPPGNEVCGAVQAIAAHPENADVIYIGAVNGGIWKTENARAATPTWVAQTENLPSQSIASLAFDPTDGSRQTLIAGIGRLSNFGQRGDDEIGIYRTTDGGSSWNLHGGATLLGQKIIAVTARGAVLMAASSAGGLFRSIDTGATWSLASGSGGLPTGGILDLIGDPGNNARFYIAVRGTTPRVLRSDDAGASWTDISAGLSGLSVSTGAIKLAIGAASTLFAAAVNSGTLAGVFVSSDMGSNWTAMAVPNIHPGGQGTVNTSIAADPVTPNIIYLGGDRIASSPFTGNLVRGDASLPLANQFSTIMNGNGGNTAPHADSRALTFDADGNLLEGDDGGIYRRSMPSSPGGTWGSVIGNLNLIEVHDLDLDRVSNILIIGTQDNGTHIQQTPGNTRWRMINGGDGGDVAADSETLAPAAGYRYLSSQNFGGPRRSTYTSANVFTGNVSLPGIADPQFVTPIELNVADSGRMLIGGLNSVYESTDITGPAPSFTTLGAPGANRNAMAYGANDNVGVAYVGKNAAVFRRSGAAFVATAALPAGANTVTDVALDPNNPLRVLAIDNDQVFSSSNGGDSWQNITGNLTTISSLDFRTIEYLSDPGGDSIAIGTRSGVFVTAADQMDWSLLGNGLPDVLVFDLRYMPSTRTLYAGTLGRGVWSHTLEPSFFFGDGFETVNRGP